MECWGLLLTALTTSPADHQLWLTKLLEAILANGENLHTKIHHELLDKIVWEVVLNNAQHLEKDSTRLLQLVLGNNSQKTILIGDKVLVGIQPTILSWLKVASRAIPDKNMLEVVQSYLSTAFDAVTKNEALFSNIQPAFTDGIFQVVCALFSFGISSLPDNDSAAQNGNTNVLDSWAVSTKNILSHTSEASAQSLRHSILKLLRDSILNTGAAFRHVLEQVHCANFL